MKRKLIGVVISDVTPPYQKRFISSFLPQMLKADCDVAVFTPLCRNGMEEDHISGEYNIISLINYDRLDGLVLVPDTLALTVDKTRRFLDDIHKKCSKPTICVDYTDTRYETIMTDDEKGMQLVVDHLIEEHGYKDILFIAGFEGHPHSIMRINGYRTSLENHGLVYDDKNVIYGDFWYDVGPDYASKILNRDKLPDAVVCANEPMALGIMSALEKKGVKIPDDIAFAGFDADGERIYKSGVLTSYARDIHTTGINAARKIVSLINSDKYVPYENNDKNITIGDTCGCKKKPEELKKYVNKGFEYIDDTGGFLTLYDFMHENMIKSSDLKDYLTSVDWYTCFLKGFDRFSICINDDLLNGEDFETDENTGYTDEMKMIFDKRREDKPVESNIVFKKEIIYPHLYDERDKPAVFYFTPFHFYKRSFGYTVLEYDGKADTYNQYFPRWMRYINTSFESLRRQVNYRLVNENMCRLYEQNSKLTDDMLRTQEQLIISFAEITESKSGQTGRHVKRVSEYSRVLGKSLGLSDEDVETLRIASMMHDVGKLSIPASILEKPGKLTPEEFDIIKTHVTEGERLMHNSPGKVMDRAKTIALQHHEKWDGSGYLGYARDQIDFFSRIVAVADVYDALVSKRSYKEAMNEKKAYDIIVADRGKHFDPRVVDAFVANYDQILDVLKSHPD
ncbi:MAG: substrate-binding domain-containing protein [Oscillospiraceae bacterium]|nr:substrate-binding domain-containing protein [Oscillospiraceae bacterium]